MKTNKLSNLIILAALIIIPYVYLASVWGELPDQVPMHYGIDGEPDRWGSKSNLLYLPGLLIGGIYLLMYLIPKIDPKKSIHKMGKKYGVLSMVMVLFMSAISCFLIYSSQAIHTKVFPLLPALMGAFFIFLGNYMQSVKPNYFIGIRTPWTLDSESVWRKTHRFGGRLMMIGGILICVMAFVLSGSVLTVSFLVVLTLVAVISLGYSYLEYKKLPPKAESKAEN